MLLQQTLHLVPSQPLSSSLPVILLVVPKVNIWFHGFYGVNDCAPLEKMVLEPIDWSTALLDILGSLSTSSKPHDARNR